MANFEKIFKNNFDRLPKVFIDNLSNANLKFDVHTHIFNFEYIPDEFFDVRFPTLVNISFLKGIDSLLDVIKQDSEDSLYNYAYFLDFINKNSTEQIAEYLISNSPQNTIFCTLMVDYSKVFSAKNSKSIEEQMDLLFKIRNKYPQTFLPFIGIDPNNPNVFDNFEKAFSEQYSFFGVKVYPALGFMPSHPNLMKIFEICQNYNIPVVAHCNIDGTHTTKSKIQLKFFDIDSSGKLILKKETKQFFFKHQYNKFFNRPQLWEPVLKAFPNLRLNLAHFDCDFDFEDDKKSQNVYRLIDLMERYPNVYSDTAYCLHKPTYASKFVEFYTNNTIIQQRLLFGSDFHYINAEGKYKELRSRFVSKIGSKIMHRISVENPLKFLDLYKLIPQQVIKQWEQQTL